jgi:ASPM-SPD-2-Hydin domain-containing protein
VRPGSLARCALLLIAGGSAFAQTVPFSLRVTQTGNASTVQNGGSLAFNSPIGQAETATVTATYSGAGQVTISQPLAVFGSTQFTVSTPVTLPAMLTAGQNFIFTIQFLPASAAQSSAQASVAYTETVSGMSSTGSILLALQGTAPSFVLSYVLQSTLNVTPLQAGGTITFPPTQVNTIAQAALNVTNAGSGTGVVTGISITGSAFKLSGVPLLPTSVTSGQNLQVLILYEPAGSTADAGQVQVTFDVGSPVTIALQGSGNSASFTYQVLQTNPPTTVPPGGTLTLSATNVGQTTSVVIRVLNTGNASGTVTTISIAGQGFQLANVPPLPQTLAPNASLTFTVSFAPTQPGNPTATLLINSDMLTVSGVGLGAQLVFSYVAGGSTIVIGSATPSVVFSPVMITQSAQLSFDVKNTGTLPATISNIGVTQNLSPFALAGVPPLPVTVSPNADFHITVIFTPTSIGFSNGTLQFDAATVPLVGSGTQPPPLPAYTISGASGNTAPLSQPSLSLTLSSSYPVEIAGALALTVSTNLVPDPAAQFSSGGVSVPFVIPANSTTAVFAGQGSQIGLQTGTVASTLTLTPSFATQAGGVNLTPANPATVQLTVAPAAPTILAAQVGSVTATGFVLTLTGFSTTRSLSTCTVQFTAAAGFSLPKTQFAIDLSQVSTLWFQGTASKASGGQFSLTIPFALQGTVQTGQTLVNSISSVSASVSNGTGTSNAMQANVP